MLRNLTITVPNHFWATDITYIPLQKGFMYLVDIIDLHIKYVLNWFVSNTMDAS
ncbi:DDE-type integrase/transposase/recombinase [Kordia jejudonensis]|uniref:DDE-type integrase/transposase/recombinase n=1 Tax=Kordia jejudonensis TaxID=1348245 RepID=UPI00373FDC02